MIYAHRTLVVLAAGAAFSLSACASKGKTTAEEAAGSVAAPAASSATSALSGALGPASALIGGLTKSIPGMSQAQAILSAGSVLGLAKGKMPADQFSQLSSAVPGTEALIEEAIKAGLPAVESLTGLSGLQNTLSKAGVTPAMLAQVVPALTKAVTAGGGKALGDAFAAAVK